MTSQLQRHCVARPVTPVRCSLRIPFSRAAPLQPPRMPFTRTRALGDSKEDEPKITRETEPDDFWQTPTEAKGENPAKDPLAIIGVVGLLLPFVILGVAIATGYVDLSNYRYGGH